MATLLLTTRGASAADDETPEPVALRAWLRGDWAILFSHPGDFVRCELEMDRWLAVVQRAFAGCRIRPLALEAQRAFADGWVSQVSGDSTRVLLAPPFAVNERACDLKAAALHRAILERAGQRFVMVIDSSLTVRRTFTYGALSEVPSPLELLGWADATRTRPAGESEPYVHPAARRSGQDARHGMQAP